MSVEERGLAALETIENEISVKERALDPKALCVSYQKIREPLESVLELVGKFPFIGPKVVNTVRFLMKVADSVCENV